MKSEWLQKIEEHTTSCVNVFESIAFLLGGRMLCKLTGWVWKLEHVREVVIYLKGWWIDSHHKAGQKILQFGIGRLSRAWRFTESYKDYTLCLKTTGQRFVHNSGKRGNSKGSCWEVTGEFSVSLVRLLVALLVQRPRSKGIMLLL